MKNNYTDSQKSYPVIILSCCVLLMAFVFSSCNLEGGKRNSGEVYREGSKKAVTEPQGIMDAPEFYLESANGIIVDSKTLKGKSYLIHFFHSRSEEWPVQYDALRTLKESNPTLVVYSVTLDPTMDTPEALLRIHDSLDMPANWQLLRGLESEVFSLAQEGFHLAASRNDANQILYSPRVVWVNGNGEVVGFYDPADNSSWSQFREEQGR